VPHFLLPKIKQTADRARERNREQRVESRGKERDGVATAARELRHTVMMN